MRRFSESFMSCLKNDFLSPIVTVVKEDKDLDFQIRDNYFNIYYKGNSLLNLSEASGRRFKVGIHEKFAAGLDIPDVILDQQSAAAFVANIPYIKSRIVRHGSTSLELEYEQLIIRANNRESRNSSEYFIIDRQYTRPAGRFDLTGIFWDRSGRRTHQEVPLCLMEVKFALNPDTKDVHKQLSAYYDALEEDAEAIAEEHQIIFCQKLELGLFDELSQAEALKTLTISRDIAEFLFVLILVDFNPNSSLFPIDRLAELPFANQIRVFRTGFAMWQQSVAAL